MAVTLLDLSGLQAQIHTQYTNSNDTPSVGSTDWLTRLNHINRAIAEWAAQKAVEWNELWTTGNTTPSTVAAGTTSYILPSDFNYMGGYVRLVDPVSGGKTPIQVVHARDAAETTANRLQRVYVTGKPGAYVLRLTWTPVTGDGTVGKTIELDYYKYPLSLSAATDTPEMSDPWYIVEAVTAKLFQTQSPTNFNIHNNAAIDLMTQMIQANEMPGYNNNSPGSISFTIGA